MAKKKHLIKSEIPKEYDTSLLLYPKDRFDLLSVDKVQTFELPYTKQISGTGKVQTYTRLCKNVLITVKCKRCGSIKSVVDKREIGCKEGPCSSWWKNLTGMVFGNLTALEYVHVPFRNGAPAKWYWKCICSCGNECYKSTHDLLNAGTHECLSCAISTKKLKVTIPNNGAAWNQAYIIARKGAQKRDLAFELTIEQFRDLCMQPCYYCGSQPTTPMRSGRLKSSLVGYRNGIDRFDNDKGYVVGNCVPCCKLCNRMKADLSYNAWVQHMTCIIHHCEERSTTIPEGSTPKQVEKDPGLLLTE